MRPALPSPTDSPAPRAPALVIAAALCAVACVEPGSPAPAPALSLAVVDATIWTGDPDRPLVEALGVAGDRIAALGSSDAIRALMTDGVIISADGASVVPGFIDAHVHMLDAGHRLLADTTGDELLLDDDFWPVAPEPPPAYTPAEDDAALDAALAYLAERGVTSVHHMGSWSDLETLERARDTGRLTARVYAAVPLPTWRRLRDAIADGRFGGDGGRGDNWLRVGALKGVVDGTVETGTAALDLPYPDSADDRGLMLYDLDRLSAQVDSADAAGLQVALHAIGSRANHLALDAYERVMEANGPRDRRFRIEHAQHLRPDDIARFADLDVIASMQPARIGEAGPQLETLVGRDALAEAFPVRSLLDAGATVAFGTNWGFAPAGPILGLYGAMTRRPIEAYFRRSWTPAERITIARALNAYTIAGAYASFEDQVKGRLAIGQLADFALLDLALLSAPTPDIRFASVVVTVAGGRIVYDAR